MVSTNNTIGDKLSPYTSQRLFNLSGGFDVCQPREVGFDRDVYHCHAVMRITCILDKLRHVKIPYVGLLSIPNHGFLISMMSVRRPVISYTG